MRLRFPLMGEMITSRQRYVGDRAHHTSVVDPATGKRLLHGNGCNACDNCFVCPFDNCHAYADRGKFYLNSTKKATES